MERDQTPPYALIFFTSKSWMMNRFLKRGSGVRSDVRSKTETSGTENIKGVEKKPES